MALMIVGLMAGSAVASDWEAVGGLQIVNVTLDTYNETIDGFNTVAEGVDPDLDKFDNIDRVPLLYLGAKKKINEKWDLNIRYEYIFGKVEQSYAFGTDSYENSIDVALHGITFLADYTINENWYATGGIGYHQGTKTTDLKGYVYDTAIPALNPNTSVEPGENEYDLDNGISLRAGVGYKRGFAENWDFNAQLDYIYIELDDEQQGNIYSNGFAYTAGLTYSF